MDVRFTGGFTLEEALLIAYSEEQHEDVTDIFITPPEAHVLTDEDSGDETELIPDHFTGRQLRAEAEIRCRGGTEVSEDSQEAEVDDGIVNDDNLQGSDEVEDTFSYENCDIRNIQWIRRDLVENENKRFPSGDYSLYKDKTPVALFELFFDDSVYLMLLEEIVRYALFLNCPNPKVTLEELKCFIGILVISGYNELSGKRFYWDSADDMKNLAVSNAMRRDKFFQIMRFLHCADNTRMNPNDKLWKLRPLIDKMQKNCLKNFVPEQHIDYDESMIKYYGHHGCKQFIRGKPVRFGYKVWSMNTKEGYLIDFEVYQGKRFIGNPVHERLFGKAAAPFVGMLRNLPDKHLPYKFYLDNLFTGIPLYNFLRQNGYSATGTVRENRIPKECPLKPKAEMKKQPRGTVDSCIAKDVGTIFVKWVDNSVVTVASTSYGVEPFSNVKRFSQSEKKIVQVQRPNLIGQYNNFMGGTDQMDGNLGRYRISIRSKKWWWCIFTWLVDVAINNARMLQRKSLDKHTDQLSFRRELANTYLKSYGVLPKVGGRPSTSKNSVTCNRVSDDIRYDGMHHLLVYTPNKNRRRCAGEECTSSVRTMCNKCNVGLCIECNLIFHTR